MKGGIIVNKIHHIAFICKDLNKVIKYYKDIIGLNFKGIEELSYRNVKVALFKVDKTLIEFISPYDEGKVMDYLNENGEGFFHIAFKTSNLKEEVDKIIAKGVKFREDKPREGLNWNLMTMEENPLGIINQLVEE